MVSAMIAIRLNDWSEIVIRFHPDKTIQEAVKQIPGAHYDF